MLLIYTALVIGGVETFYVRMAKERFRCGLKTTILLLSSPSSSDPTLLEEMNKYATVYHSNDFFYSKNNIPTIYALIVPAKKEKISIVLNNIKQIHVSNNLLALVGYRLTQMVNINIPITVGIYHYLTFLWQAKLMPYHERINRKFMFSYLPQECILFYSEGTRSLYQKYKSMNFDRANTFRLGVIDKKQNSGDLKVSGEKNTPLKIVAVGRFVEFKTYNLYILDVIRNLLDKGFDIQLDYYGYGPLEDSIKHKIDILDIHQNVNFKGVLDYLNFDKTIEEYDLFIGSGTAIIQASALGVPSIVGVENTTKPYTYGFFCDVYQHDFNIKGLDLPEFSVEDLILQYSALSQKQRVLLRLKHIQSVEDFTNQQCSKNIESLNVNRMPAETFKYNSWLYIASWLVDKLYEKSSNNHPRRKMHREFKG